MCVALYVRPKEKKNSLFGLCALVCWYMWTCLFMDSGPHTKQKLSVSGFLLPFKSMSSSTKAKRCLHSPHFLSSFFVVPSVRNLSHICCHPHHLYTNTQFAQVFRHKFFCFTQLIQFNRYMQIDLYFPYVSYLGKIYITVNILWILKNIPDPVVWWQTCTS